ncbi:MAG: hypothetical protein P8H35_08580 [Flavobacteriales bacterium]|nr:hypothetical protein [Flavobacteriales bacterium]
MEKALKNLNRHPYTQIQLSDREKFHTGMLKITLDVFKKEAYAGIFGDKFANELYTPEDSEIKTCLEENSVDLSIKNGEKVFAIFESKFKTGLHYSKMKIEGESQDVNQLEKYARKNSNTEYGFVISLFEEEKLEIDIKGVAITEFTPLTFTNQILKFLLCFNYEDYDDPTIPLVELWISYLKELKIVVDEFEKIQLEGISNHKEVKKLLTDIKLKGIFERHRLNIIKNNIEDHLIIEEDLKNKLIEGAKIWGKPEPENNYIIIGNTHGNASISFVFKTEKENSYGIQWQTGSVKIFIDIKQKQIKMREDRHEQLNSLVGKLKDFKYVKEKANMKNIFQSITIIKKEIFEDITKMHDTLISILKILKANPPSNL